MVSYTPNDNDHRAVQFVVDNTYKSIPLHEAKLDRTGRYRKTHEYTLFIDVVVGDPGLIKRVVFNMGPKFNPPKFICTNPIRIIQPNGSPTWRFSTTQQVCGARTPAEISICGARASLMVVTHNIQLNTRLRNPSLLTFSEYNDIKSLQMVKIDDAQKFGIELELSSPPGIDSQMIADMMPPSAGSVIVGGARHAAHTDGWKVVHDGSITCNRNMPACNKFELVSRILVGRAGLRQIADVTRALSNAQITINKSMGFHVHVDVSGYSVEQLIKICQNFIKVR